LPLRLMTLDHPSLFRLFIQLLPFRGGRQLDFNRPRIQVSNSDNFKTP
jgi:hypothetical protein